MNWISKTRGIAILAVLMIHVNTPLLYESQSSVWWLGHIFDSLSRLAVPLFLMISGALLLHKEEPVGFYIEKRAAKIFIPFIVWSVIYFICKLSGEFNVKLFIQQFLSGKIYYHLWYFYILIPLYIFIPFLRRFVRYIPSSYIIIYALISSGASTINDVIGIYGLNMQVFSNPFSVGVSYLLLGYIIARREYELKYYQLYGAVSFLIILLGTYLITAWRGTLSQVFYDALGLPVLMYAVMVFYLCKKYLNGSTPTYKGQFLEYIGKYSFGIYLIHPLLLSLMTKFPTFSISASTGSPYIMMPVTFAVVLSCSLLFIIPLSKIPILKRIT
ncbi:acyltransferase [Priestia megaterium]|uniref:acyltransferase n=1 Tax=Priestia megaterium TaxID=1404 RepID=UPI0035D6D2F5